MKDVDFKTLLEEIPPNTEIICSSLIQEILGNGICRLNSSIYLQLFCPTSTCNSYMQFAPLTNNPSGVSHSEASYITLKFRCRNCNTTEKTFNLRTSDDFKTQKVIQKLGEFPYFGKPMPKKVSKLLGSERKLFFKGRKCENQGMGVGAFTYYRRVLDSQKDRIFDEVIKVAKLNTNNEEVIKELEAAKQESQFTKAVENIKHAFPQALLLNGHNPLTLMYSALSEGLHNHDDDTCLELAQSIRTVLFEFSERLDTALKESNELSSAIRRLVKVKQKA
jgi:hypothetical protein